MRTAVNVARHAETVLRESGDEAGAQQARATAQSLVSPRVSLVVAGEFQQGKSSLINALLGARVTPTEPLATTTVPIRFGWGRRPACRALLGAGAAVEPTGDAADGDEGPVPGPARAGSASIGFHELGDLAVTEQPEVGGRSVNALEVKLDHPLLRSGVELLDTPCVSGGLSTQTAGLVLGLLQQADGLVFVTDASQELTAPELELLRMARTLCPALLVVLTKIDLYPEWRRILDINHDYLADVDPEATCLPASPQLKAASLRWSDVELERASGLPLVAWYLGSTMLARARRSAIERVGKALSTRLGSAAATVEGRLAVLERSTGRHRADEQFKEAAARLELLRGEAPKRARLELRTFSRGVAADLTNRFSSVNDLLADLIKRVDPAEQWSEIEATMHRVTNRALAEHLTFVAARAEAVIAGLSEQFGLDLAGFSSDVQEPDMPAERPEMDQPDFSSAKASRVHDVTRGAVSSAFMGVGLATTILAGPLGPLALGAGASLSTVVLGWRRERSRDLEGRRAKALQTCRSWLTDARAALSSHADDIYKELEFQLESHLENGLQGKLKEVETERARLEVLRKVAADKVPEEVRRVRAELQALRVVHAHARRLEHRLARPDVQGVSGVQRQLAATGEATA